MYEDFYCLRSRPFLTIPNPDFLFWSETHILAFTMLRYGMISRAPFTVVTGEIGSGKTTLLRQLLREIAADVEVALVSNMQAGRGELLEWVMAALGQPVTPGESYVQLFQRLQDHVIQSYAAGRRFVLIFDEAQNMSPESLEELRMLSNINSDSDELIQIILSGQPQLRELLNKTELLQFKQRISADFHIGPLDKNETERYIHHRLDAAGAQWRIFPSRTCELIYEATAGIPRLVNILCDLCLVYGFSAEEKIILEEILREFMADARRRNIYQQFHQLAETPKLVRHAQ